MPDWKDEHLYNLPALETLRDRFAMAAISGQVDDHGDAASTARWAYEIADAMMLARSPVALAAEDSEDDNG